MPGPTYRDVITVSVDLKVPGPGANVTAILEAMYDIIMGRTGTSLYDKRRNAEAGSSASEKTG